MVSSLPEAKNSSKYLIEIWMNLKTQRDLFVGKVRRRIRNMPTEKKGACNCSLFSILLFNFEVKWRETHTILAT